MPTPKQFMKNRKVHLQSYRDLLGAATLVNDLMVIMTSALLVLWGTQLPRSQGRSE